MIDLSSARRTGVALATVLFGCSFEHDPAGTRFRCDEQAPCPAGTTCSPDGFCEAAIGELDAGDVDGGVVAPPTMVQDTETNWTFAMGGGSKETPEFDVLVGDVLVAYAISENVETSVGSITGGGLDWVERKRVVVGGHSWVGLWTVTADADTAMSVRFTLDQGSEGWFGAGVVTFRGSDGVGPSEADTGQGPATLALTTTRAHSAIVIANGDWNAQDGPHAWRDDAGMLDETSYFYDAGIYAAYAGVHSDVGPAGTYEVGLSAPVDQIYALVAIEVFGATGSP